MASDDDDAGGRGSLVDAVATGERRVALEALRGLLAERLENPYVVCANCEGPALVAVPTAAVARELRAVVDELARLAPPKGSKGDEIKQKRERRRAASVSARPAGGNPRRGPGGDRAR